MSIGYLYRYCKYACAMSRHRGLGAEVGHRVQAALCEVTDRAVEGGEAGVGPAQVGGREAVQGRETLVHHAVGGLARSLAAQRAVCARHGGEETGPHVEGGVEPRGRPQPAVGRGRLGRHRRVAGGGHGRHGHP